MKHYCGRHRSKKNRVNIRAKNKNLFFVLFVVAIVILSTSIGGIMAYFTSNDSIINRFSIIAEYKVIFNPNGGTGSPYNQTISYNVATPLTANSFQKTGCTFREWNTMPDGSGQSYSNQEAVTNIISGNSDTVNLYAQWDSVNGVAEINGAYFPSLKAAVNSVTDQDGQVTINLLQDTSDRISVGTGIDIIINLQNHTLKNSEDWAIVENTGTLKITGGTVETETKNEGAINNRSGGILTIDNARVIMSKSGGKQAVYNEGGQVEIKGDSYLYSVSTIRATVQNQAGGSMTIKSGTIISTGYAAAVNNGTDFTVGTKDGNPDKTSPILQGATYGVTSNEPINFYNGMLKGKTAAKSGSSTFNDTETGFGLINKTELIDGQTYRCEYLGNETIVTLKMNDGTTGTDLHIAAENGTIIDPIPTPTRYCYQFDGWYTSASGGELLTPSTQITANTTYYAHWTQLRVAEINGTQYYTIQEAVNQVSSTSGVEETVTLLYDVQENMVQVSSGQVVKIDLQGHKMVNKGATRVIDNFGTLTITNGKITSDTSQGAVNNESGGILYMSDGSIEATGSRQAIYNNGGRVEISGTARLSATSGERAAVHNLNNGTVIITGGTIISTGHSAVVNASGTVTIGVKDDNFDPSTPIMQGKTYGINNSSTLYFYNGTARGKTKAINGTVSGQEDDSNFYNGNEVIDGETYKVSYLVGI